MTNDEKLSDEELLRDLVGLAVSPPDKRVTAALNRILLDARRWIAFSNNNLAYTREPRTGEEANDGVRWTIWCEMPNKALFTPAVDALIAAQDKQEKQG